MTGREAFKKFGRVINILIAITKILPRRYRQWRFNSLREKNGRFGMLKRYVYLCTLSKSVGDNVSVFPGVYILHPENLSVGSNVSIHQMCYIDAEGGIEIGNDVSVAHRCTLLSSNHRYEDADTPIKYQGMEKKKTVIGDNTWIGCACTVLAGATVGQGCVIGANSVVVKDIEDNSVAVGAPAKKIKDRIKK